MKPSETSRAMLTLCQKVTKTTILTLTNLGRGRMGASSSLVARKNRIRQYSAQPCARDAAGEQSYAISCQKLPEREGSGGTATSSARSGPMTGHALEAQGSSSSRAPCSCQASCSCAQAAACVPPPQNCWKERQGSESSLGSCS